MDVVTWMVGFPVILHIAMNMAKALAKWLNIGGTGIGVLLVVAGAAMIVIPRFKSRLKVE